MGAKQHFLLACSLLTKFQANSLPAGRVGRCGFKTNAKIGSTFSPQAGNFEAKNIETDTSDVGSAAMLGVGCTARAQVKAAWVRDPSTVNWLPWGSPFLPAIGVIFNETPPRGGIWIWIGLIFVIFRRIQGRRWGCLIARMEGANECWVSLERI